MPIQLCKSCKWWGKDYRLSGKPLNDDMSNWIRGNSRVCWCHHLRLPAINAPEFYLGPSMINWYTYEPIALNGTCLEVNNNGDTPYVWTGPDFGCVHHELMKDS